MLSMYGLQSPLPLHAHTSTGSARPRLGPARFRIAAAAAETTVKRGRGRPKKSVAPTEEVAAPVKPPVKQKKKEPIVLLDDTDSEDSFSEPNVKHEEQVVNEDEDEDAEENEDDENEDSKPNKTKSSSTAEAKNESKPAGPPPVPKPWERMSEATKEAQLATAMDYMQRKKLDASVQSAEKSYVRNADSILHLVRDKAWLEKEKLFMRQTEEGPVPDYGALGEGQLHWYALQVNSEKSMKHVARFIASQVAELPGLDGTFKEPRQFDIWLPSKIIKSYNWRTEKMGNKTVKWRHGQELLVKCIMDRFLDRLITANRFTGTMDLQQDNKHIGGYRFFQHFTDRNGRQHLIPEPCSEAYIAEVEEWMETPEVRSKEEVMADEFGEVAIAGPLAGESNRMDTRADIVEVFDDETGRKDRRTGKTQQLRRYKDDAYRGTFSNPSNWYDADSGKAASGAAPARAFAQDEATSGRRERSRRDAAPARTQRGTQRDFSRQSWDASNSATGGPSPVGSSQSPSTPPRAAPQQQQFQPRQQQQEHQRQHQQQRHQQRFDDGARSRFENRQSQQSGPEQYAPSTGFASQRKARQAMDDPFDSSDSGEWPLPEDRQLPALTADRSKTSTPAVKDEHINRSAAGDTSPPDSTPSRASRAAAPVVRDTEAGSASEAGVSASGFEAHTSSLSEDDYWNQFLPPEGQPGSIGSAKRTGNSSKQVQSSTGFDAWTPDNPASTSAPSFGNFAGQQQQQQPQKQPQQQPQQQQPQLPLSRPPRKETRVNNERIKDRVHRYRAATASDSKPLDSRWTAQPADRDGDAGETDYDWSGRDRTARQGKQARGRSQARGSSRSPSSNFRGPGRGATAPDSWTSSSAGLDPFTEGSQEDEWGRFTPATSQQVASSSGQGRVDLQQEDAWSTDAFDFGDIGPSATQQPDYASSDRPPSREGFTRPSQHAMRGRSNWADSPRGSQRSGRGGRGSGGRGGQGRGAGNGHMRDSGRQQRSSRGGWSAQPGRGGGRSRPDQGFYSPPGRGNEQPRQDQGFYSVPAEPAASGSADAFWNDI